MSRVFFARRFDRLCRRGVFNTPHAYCAPRLSLTRDYGRFTLGFIVNQLKCRELEEGSRAGNSELCEKDRPPFCRDRSQFAAGGFAIPESDALKFGQRSC